MTVLAAFVTDSYALMASDGRAMDEGSSTIPVGPKFRRVGAEWLVGSCGSDFARDFLARLVDLQLVGLVSSEDLEAQAIVSEAGELLDYDPEEAGSDPTNWAYLFASVWKRWARWQGAGAVQPNGPKTYGAAFLLATPGALYTIDGCGSVVPLTGMHHADGSGGDVAAGYLDALWHRGALNGRDEYVFDAVRDATWAACRRNAFCGGPVYLGEIERREGGGGSFTRYFLSPEANDAHVFLTTPSGPGIYSPKGGNRALLHDSSPFMSEARTCRYRGRE